MKPLAALALALLAACSQPTKPDKTYAQCARETQNAGGFTADPMHNILRHDDLIRECLGEQARK